MKPSLGRIVIYRYHPTELCAHTNGAIECPAVIVRVWNERTVNLKLIEDGPMDSWRTSVLAEDENAAGTPGRWSWPVKV